MIEQEVNKGEEKMVEEVNKGEDEKKNLGSSSMEEIEIEKIVLSIGAVGDDLDKAVKLLNIISGINAVKTKSRKRIPAFDVRPGLEIGCKVTLRGKKYVALLKRLLESVGNQLKEKQIEPNGFSFGIPEYIEIPEMEYQRDIGMIGLNVTVVFTREGARTGIRKIKKGKIPKRQQVSQEEIIKFMKLNFKTEILTKSGQEEEY